MTSQSQKYKAIDSRIKEFLKSSIFEDKQIDLEDKQIKAPPISPGEHKISNTSTELWYKILDHVDLQDVLSLRFTCKFLGQMGLNHLYKTFVIRPDRKDLERFDLLSSQLLSSSVRSVQLALGTLGINYALENLGFAYLEKYNRVRNTRPGDITTRSELDKEKNEAIDEYAKWNARWHNSQQDFTAVEPLQRLFEQATGLNRIEMAYKACPFRNELLMNAWIQGTHNHTFKQKVKEFRAVSGAIRGAKSTIKHFSHDSLPWVIFTLKPQKLLEIFEPFEKLTSIRLTFDATETPTAKFWFGLGIVLKSMPDLTDVHIGFAPFQSGFKDQGTWQDSGNAAQWYVPLQHMFANHEWRALEQLRLDGLVVCEAGLAEFLERHSTLKVLVLTNIALWKGTFQGLLSKVSAMSLGAFRMWGVFSAFGSVGESWRFGPGYDTDVENWSKEFKEYVRGRAAEDLVLWEEIGQSTGDYVRRGLESFAFQRLKWYGLEQWPLSPSNGILDGRVTNLGRIRNHSKYCSQLGAFCNLRCLPLSPLQIEYQWGALIKEVNDTSGDFASPDLPGVGEPAFATFYNRHALGNAKRPVDIYGFDANGKIGSRRILSDSEYLPITCVAGRQRGLMHYGALYDRWSKKDGNISAMKAYRVFLDGVLGSIPRYRLRSQQTGVAVDRLNVIEKYR